MTKKRAQLKLVNIAGCEAAADPAFYYRSFLGAGGITEGFREAGYRCLYANDCMRKR